MLPADPHYGLRIPPERGVAIVREYLFKRRHTASCITASISILSNSLEEGLRPSGCSMTLPVTGIVEGTGENFVGSAMGRMDGAGTLTITSNKGAT